MWGVSIKPYIIKVFLGVLPFIIIIFYFFTTKTSDCSKYN